MQHQRRCCIRRLRDFPEEVTVLEHLVVADDLSGAAESAATYLLRTTRITVHLAADGSDVADLGDAGPRVVVLDSDTRHAAPDAAGDAVARYAAHLVGSSLTTRVVTKVDSLLRGNLGLNAFLRRQPGNIAAADDDLGGAVRYSLAF